MIKNNKKGFTLLELLIVIGMTVVVFAFSMPFGLRYYRGQIIDEATNNIIDTLRNARQYSVLQKNDSPFGVNFTNSTGNFVLFQGSDYSTRAPLLDEVYPLTSGISLSGLSQVVFAKQTGTPSATGTITVSYDILTKTVLVSDSGISKQ